MTEPSTTVTTIADGIARISWTGEEPIDVIRHNVVAALADHARVEALVDPDDEGAQRAATWSGLRREGVMRGVTVDGAPVDRIVYARLATDTPLHEPEGFRALLNSFLPRKRAIGQMLVRDRDGRVLLCHLTYKTDWDLPGGVVEVNESPRVAVGREIKEELGLDIAPGGLVLADWLPAWSGWDDAVCLVFDGGTHDAALTETIVREAREIRTAEFCTPAQVRDRCADFTARRIEAALANVDAGRGPSYTESGR
ncbi:NUDIX hydrolase [Nocardioides sp. YIM 152315]|uniref:NUDIX hydrolase n=1 Tax=Nocardioides sp. YIM 152315 TaxID=3031760 RepID=UPI0023DAF0E2|nr:NUDIX hydrolase [Nocardioides sp. YIM 152315]MDF1606487.1 NUDIX hydrolase [Nocardioides sp. YIM 152315]